MFWLILYLIKLLIQSVGIVLLPIKDEFNWGKSIGLSLAVLLVEAIVWAYQLTSYYWLLGFDEYKWVVMYFITLAINGVIRLLSYGIQMLICKYCLSSLQKPKSSLLQYSAYHGELCVKTPKYNL